MMNVIGVSMFSSEKWFFLYLGKIVNIHLIFVLAFPCHPIIYWKCIKIAEIYQLTSLSLLQCGGVSIRNIVQSALLLKSLSSHVITFRWLTVNWVNDTEIAFHPAFVMKKTIACENDRPTPVSTHEQRFDIVTSVC